MDRSKSKIAYLLSLLGGDDETLLPESLQLKLLEQILEIDPQHLLARELHEQITASSFPLNAVSQCMAEVEWLAANGATRLAREGAESIRDNWSKDQKVQNWFTAINLLLDRRLWEAAPASAA